MDKTLADKTDNVRKNDDAQVCDICHQQSQASVANPGLTSVLSLKPGIF